jgi:hypothetical protein
MADGGVCTAVEGGEHECKGGAHGREGMRTDKGRVHTVVEGGAHG